MTTQAPVKYRMHVERDESGKVVWRARIITLDGVEGIEVKRYESCSGCCESNEGYPPTGAEFHPRHRIPLGLGCPECGYHGFRLHRDWVPLARGPA